MALKSLAARPIGIFDSGLGGLTVFQALSRRMPHENLVYFGDTARVPYGSKSREAVTRYSLQVAEFLAGRGIKVLVVACNTSSALALEAIKRRLSIPVLGVIEPGARAAARATRRGTVGIIGTEATIASGAYERALKARSPRVKAVSRACPLFVPLVEEGWWAHPVAEAVAREYLGSLKRARVDSVILGCTHYPLLKNILGQVLGPRVNLIDSAEQTALETENLLENLNLRKKTGKAARAFYVSDSPERFLKLSRRLLGVKVGRVVRHPLD
ncbi:MAG: glutamate racemase [Elusimicrobia bacterium]|nr:glutamate racemase [Elusimicrobiota bacterium]